MTPTDRQVDLTGLQASWPAAALALWRDATERVLALRDSWHPAPIEGDHRLREVLGAILHDDPDQILITSGVRAGASVIARGARRIRHERPSFKGTVAVLRSFHPDLELLSWDELSTISCSPAGAGSESVLWLTTPWRNPDGATLVAADWQWIKHASRANRVVVNEVYRWFGRAAERPERVWMTGSLSKLAGSGAGLGWIRGPGVERLAGQQHSRPSLCWQRCWCYLMEHGALEMFVSHTVRPAAAACEAFGRELRRVSGIDHLSASGGWPPFLLLPVPTSTAGEFAGRLASAGIHVGPGEDFLATTPSIRVCFVGVTEDGAQHAARTIGAELTAGARDCVGIPATRLPPALRRSRSPGGRAHSGTRNS